MSNDNQKWKHPELIEGEIFLCNSNVRDFSSIALKSKRWGFQPYDIYNDPIRNKGTPQDIYPVFVDSKEYDMVKGKI